MIDDRRVQVRCRVLAALWIAAVIVVSVQATLQHNNNYEIFRTASAELLAGRDLYDANARHQDLFKYSPTFALFFVPFAALPFGLGLLLWNGLNAATLYWALGRILNGEQAFAARVIVFLDTVGSMQNAQSNALVAGLMILTLAELDRRREFRAALAVSLGTVIKIFPLLAASVAIFRPFRVPRFALVSLATGSLLLAVPLLVVSPAELAQQYRSWLSVQRVDALDRGYSVMQQLHMWFGVNWPNKPVQLVGLVVLVAPLVRLSYWGQQHFRLLYLASVLMFCVLFNHKSESPTFIVAVAGIAIWFAVAQRNRVTWATLAVVIVGTVLSSSDVMPERAQEGLFEPYRLKTLPVLLVWILTQRELWRRSVSAQRPDPESVPEAPAT